MPTILRSHIPSFVRREGRITKRQRQAIAEHWPRYGCHTDQGMLVLPPLSGQSLQGVVLEIGFGMGDGLLEAAINHPNYFFIGIEVYRPALGNFLANLAKYQLDNVRVFAEDAIWVLRKAIPAQSLDKIQIFFPDPWPKRRHHKRRLIQDEFIGLIKDKLKTPAYLHIATDWQDYAEHINKVLTHFPCFKSVAAPNQAASLYQLPNTKFANRAVALGHPVTEWLLEA